MSCGCVPTDSSFLSRRLLGIPRIFRKDSHPSRRSVGYHGAPLYTSHGGTTSGQVNCICLALHPRHPLTLQSPLKATEKLPNPRGENPGKGTQKKVQQSNPVGSDYEVLIRDEDLGHVEVLLLSVLVEISPQPCLTNYSLVLFSPFYPKGLTAC